MTYHDIQSYILAKQAWEQTPDTIYPDGTMLLKVKGKQVTKKEFDRHNTRPSYMPMPKTNPNGHVNMTGVIPKKQR